MSNSQIHSTLPTQNGNREVNTVMWEQLSERVDSFCTAWDGDPPATISDFIPNDNPTLRRFVLIELIKVDMEYRWLKHDMPKPVEEYIGEFPELVHEGKFPIDLIYEEYHVRKQTDETPTAQSYFERFPNERETLERLFGEETEHTVSTMVTGRKEPVFEPNESIDDFDLIYKLGKGAFASVFLARQRSMQRNVALKISRNMKINEHQTLAQLDHPNIVRVYDHRILPEQKLLLMYMQHIPGGTLHAVVDKVRKTPPSMRRGTLLLDVVENELSKAGQEVLSDSPPLRRFAHKSWSEVVCWLGVRMARGLDFAHQRGVLHRDIKPANVLLASDGEPKLADFNVSFSSKAEGANASSFFGGSLAYMSPEQLEATDPHEKREPKDLDGRSDVFSLAVMMWELLTGKRPFPEDTDNSDWGKMLRYFLQVRKAEIPDDAKAMLPKDLPEGMLDVLYHCLEPNPADRPATAGDVAKRLDRCLTPKAQKLFEPRSKSSMQMMRDRPLLFFILTGVLPNAILSAVNIHFNVRTVTRELFNDWEFFVKVLIPVNGIAYPFGIITGYLIGSPIVKAVRAMQNQRANSLKKRVPSQNAGSKEPAENAQTNTAPEIDLVVMRKKCLRMGLGVGLITFCLWAISGVVIPYCVKNGIDANKSFEWDKIRMLFSSQILFGIIAATQVFYWMTYLNIHVYYPTLVSSEKNDEQDVGHLNRIETIASWMFWVALATPFMAIAIFMQQMLQKMMQLKQDQMPNVSQMQDSSIVFLIITGFGFAASISSFLILGKIKNDVAVLSTVLTASEQQAGASWSESTDSFLSGTR